MALGVRFSMNESLFLRDPQETVLGRKILKFSIELIDEIGFEDFTFKKLAARMGSTEASVYRYFKNKHLLLIFLVCWYWEWVSYLIEIGTTNVSDPKEKLRIIIHNLVSAIKENPAIDYINERLLHRIVISDGMKAYHTKSVDVENNVGLFLNYKQLVKTIGGVILEINPTFPYPHALASNMFEMANNHIFFAQHLPRLTDIEVHGEQYDEVEEMLNFFAFRILRSNQDEAHRSDEERA